MYVAETTEFAVNLKRPLLELFDQGYAAALKVESGEPTVQFLFSDRAGGRTSPVRSALSRIPALAEFATDSKGRRILSNGPGSPAAGLRLDSASLRQVLAGIPKPFSFEEIVLSLRIVALGPALGTPIGAPGIAISYSGSGVLGGRSISARALRVIEADPNDKHLPLVPQGVESLFTAVGAVKATRQRVFNVGPESSSSPRLVARFAGPSAQTAAAIRQLVDGYRGNLTNTIAQAGLPYKLPAPALAGASASELRSGAMKRELVQAFTPLGYDCRAIGGTYTLRRRTRGNLVIDIHLDVGAWRRSLSGLFAIQGLGFIERMPLPVSPEAWGGGQYPIDGQAGWARLVGNLAAVVTEYDRSLTPAVEALCDPIPDWYRPEL